MGHPGRRWRLLGWSPTLIPATHWSSLGARGNNETQRLLRLYDSPQLVELVANKFRSAAEACRTFAPYVRATL